MLNKLDCKSSYVSSGDGCILYGQGVRVDVSESENIQRRFSFKRIKTQTGTFCHTVDYKHASKKRDNSRVVVIEENDAEHEEQWTVYEIENIFLEISHCSCDINMCRTHSEVKLIGREVNLSRYRRSPASHLHVHNASQYLSCDHIAKVISISNFTTALSLNSVQNSVVSLDNYVSILPYHKHVS